MQGKSTGRVPDTSFCLDADSFASCHGERPHRPTQPSSENLAVHDLEE
ncbi:MAG: hypothetical protein NZ990_11575 [Myxococcota bacterium]|nr:hypothetical protein [Myxococcota bacterium]